MSKYHRQFPIKVITAISLILMLSVSLNTFAAAEKAQAVELTVKTNGESLQSAFQQLEVIRQKNQTLKQQLTPLQQESQQALANLNFKDIDKTLIEQVDLQESIAKANVDGATLAKAQAQQAEDSILSKINNIENQLQNITLAAGKTSAVKLRIAALQAQLNFQKAALRSQQKMVQELTQTQQIYQSIYEIRAQWQTQVNQMYHLQQKQKEQLELKSKVLQLQDLQKEELDKLMALNQAAEQLDISHTDYAQQSQKLEVRILQAQEKSNIAHTKIILLNQQGELQTLTAQGLENKSASELDDYISQAKSISREITTVTQLIERKKQLLTQRIQLTDQRRQAGYITQEQYDYQSKAIERLLSGYNSISAQMIELSKKTSQYSQACQAALTQALSRRQGLPGLDAKAWNNFAQDILKMPLMTLQAVNALKDQFSLSLRKLNTFSIMSIIFVEILWLCIWIMLRSILAKVISGLSDKRQNISKNTLYIVLQIIQRNLFGIFIVAGLSILFWLTGLPTSSFEPVIYIAIVWFVFKIAIGLARLVLLENVGDASGRDVILYNELKWALLAGGVLTTLTVLAHQLPVGYQVTDFFNRLFMLFMLIISLLLIRGWQVAPALVEPYIDDSKPYLMKLVKLLSFLIPLTIFSTAMIGIFGYVDLAWAISWYEGVFLLVMSGYIIARGFLKDALEWISELFIRNLKNGWLWTQALLRPLDKVLRVLLFLIAVVVLFSFYGWGSDSVVVQKLISLLHFHLVDAKGLVITPISIIELVIAATIVYWISRWTREFAYRWLFAKTRDLGLRNSLAVLTQYTAFMISIFIALKIIGIDLSGISYVLAGFAAGVGLGLRDLIKNYASGLLLLFERPLRVGDLVTVGECEGEVTHIGMRAVTVKTWDHMEVMVPNSETFEKPFTNWTHLDSIVRTVINLKVAPGDDPFFVQSLILKTLEHIEEIVSDPEPQVYFKEMNEALLSFEVRYYINLQLGSTRAKVRSLVLFKIFEAFRDHGIKPPHPPQDVYLRSMPD